MPAIAKLSPKRWESLKLANIAGCDDKELASRFRVKAGTIRVRRHEDKEWSRAFAKVRTRIKAAEREREANMLTEMGDNVAETLNGIGEGTNLLVARMTHDELVKFARKPAPLIEWSEANTAFSMLRKATGQDKEGVNVGMIFAWPSSSEVPTQGRVVSPALPDGSVD